MELAIFAVTLSVAFIFRQPPVESCHACSQDVPGCEKILDLASQVEKKNIDAKLKTPSDDEDTCCSEFSPAF